VKDGSCHQSSSLLSNITPPCSSLWDVISRVGVRSSTRVRFTPSFGTITWPDVLHAYERSRIESEVPFRSSLRNFKNKRSKNWRKASVFVEIFYPTIHLLIAKNLWVNKNWRSRKNEVWILHQSCQSEDSKNFILADFTLRTTHRSQNNSQVRVNWRKIIFKPFLGRAT